MNRFKLQFTIALLVVASGSPEGVLANAAGGLKPVIERVTALEARSAALEDDLANARSDIGSLQASLAQALGRIDGLDGSLAEALGRIAGLEGGLERAELSISDLGELLGLMVARIDDVEADIERMQTELAEVQMESVYLGHQVLLELEGFAKRVGDDQIAQLTALKSEFSALEMSTQFLESLTIPFPGGDLPLSIPEIEFEAEDVERLAEAALAAAQELRCLFGLPGCVTAEIEPLRWLHRLNPDTISAIG